MSDELDADLYGDLYETDAGGSSEQQQIDTSSSQTPAATTKEDTTVEEPDYSVPELNTATTLSSSKDTNTGQTPTTTTTTLTTPATQQIPTYEDNTSSGYRDGISQSMANQGYQSNAIVDSRSIRPSEMKDEG
ncbi:hypothetical protein L218DRAFT_996547 [Marasmius fiardii PR-910]|nr:hypothetical protein L218DRAFT_996547 [Marasmius fiardii PR-910]